MNEILVQRPRRWDQPFDEDMQEQQVLHVLASPHFRNMQPANFPKALQLEDLIRNDCRIRRFDKHQLMVRAGEYLNSAFLILSGKAIMVSPPGIDPGLWGQVSVNKISLGKSIKRWWSRHRLPEVRTSVSALKSNTGRRASDKGRVIIDNVEELIAGASCESETLHSGDFYGESAVLGRNEITNTVIALEPIEVLEIRWQGLREIRKREAGFRDLIDDLYRQRGLSDHLLSVPLFQHLSPHLIKELSKEALFEVHGEFEWQRGFKTISEQANSEADYNKLIESEPLIACEGDSPDGLLLIRNGFGRVSRNINFGHYTLSYLSKGGMFGLDELHAAWLEGKPKPLNCSFRALGYVDAIRIPTQWLEKNIFESESNEALKGVLEESLGSSITMPPEQKTTPVQRELTEFLVENRFINGSAAMVIDLQRCIRCDDCVQACANAHDNNPRFNRHGKSFGRYMIANACMHCEDPVCMIGCPTGAIHRAPGGEVKINDPTCIGCSTCANNCPYDNIRMVEVRDESNQLFKDATHKPILKATKCDLCSEVSGKPACERACPHDALTRLDLKDIAKLSNWVDR
ncbi:MAG: 4Fe-4S dicluster domain-containing protein [Gammaproteobacteria bacterium]|nr:4Fe-4S dicluster domain-containing protein [Gammaproteobacteria bacterium]